MRSLALLCGVIGAFLALAFCGCAARAPLHVGHTYFVQWPGVPMGVVIVEEVGRNGYAVCRSVKDLQEWICNFNMALYFSLITQPQSQTLQANK